MKKRIETENLLLLSCDEEMCRSGIAGKRSLENLLQVRVADHWMTFGTDPLRFTIEKLREAPKEFGWWTYFPVLKAENILIGSGGYKGPPEDGAVEIGYEIAPAYRNKGLATEMSRGLITNAFESSEVEKIYAFTLGTPNASTRVLTKNGFHKIHEINDPEDGLIWKWVLNKNDG